MPRLIDADALIAYCDKNWIPLNVDAVNAQPTIEPERKTGKWTKSYGDHVAFGMRPYFLFCSECNRVTAYEYNYCPNCGAYMGGD